MKKGIYLLTVLVLNIGIAKANTFEKTLKKEGFDTRTIQNLDQKSIKILENSIKNDSEFLKEFIKQANINSTAPLSDPKVLVEAVEAKNELKQSFSANQLDEFKQFIGKSIAAEAQFPVVNSFGKTSSNVFAIQYIAYREVPVNSGNYIGYGLYMTIDTSTLEGELSSNLPYLVASATVSNKQFTFGARLVGFEGVQAHKLLRDLMPGANFGIDTYVGYQKFKDALIDALETNSLNISPVPIEPMFKLGVLDADSMALARTHGLISVAKRISLADALESSADQTNIAYSVIKDVYLEHSKITKHSNKPSRNQSEKVKKILNDIGINIL